MKFRRKPDPKPGYFRDGSPDLFSRMTRKEQIIVGIVVLADLLLPLFFLRACGLS